MKQTKKLTRDQHRFLQKYGIDTKGCRLVEDTKEYIDYMNITGEVIRFWKGNL